jgi:hypothetical protein
MPRLTEEETYQLLAHLLWLPELFSLAKTRVHHNNFDIFREPECLVIWSTALDLTRRYGDGVLFENRMQARNLLQTESMAFARQHPEEISPATFERLFGSDAARPGFFTWVYEVTQAEELHADYGRDLLRRFLLERNVLLPLRRQFHAAGEYLIGNLPELLDESAKQIAAIQQLGSGGAGSLADSRRFLSLSSVDVTGQNQVLARTVSETMPCP